MATSKQRRFVEEYLVDLNGTQAAIRAGYSKGTARVTASRLLTDVAISGAIAERRAEISKKLEISVERVVGELAAIGFANIADFYTVAADGTLKVDTGALQDRDKAAAIAQIDVQNALDGSQTIKIKLADKKAALVELGKHLGLFSERQHQLAPVEQEAPSIRHTALAVINLLKLAQREHRQQLRGVKKCLRHVSI